jgi:hypothetical protein
VSLADLLARGRSAAETLMTDACTVTRVTAQTTDPNTGAVTDTRTTVYEGPCKVRQVTSSEPAQVGEAKVVVGAYVLSLPMSAAAVHVDDDAEITASGHDPALVGRVLRVAVEHAASHVTARRLVCEEAQT